MRYEPDLKPSDLNLQFDRLLKKGVRGEIILSVTVEDNATITTYKVINDKQTKEFSTLQSAVDYYNGYDEN